MVKLGFSFSCQKARYCSPGGHSDISVYTFLNKKCMKRGLFCSRMRKARNTFRSLEYHFSGKRGWFCQNLFKFFGLKLTGVLHLWALFLKTLCIFSKNKATSDNVSYGSGQKCSKELENYSFTSVETIVVKLQWKMCENQYFPCFEP